MPHVIKICWLNENIVFPTFLALSQKLSINKNHSRLSILQKFDLNILFLRISLPVSNTSTKLMIHSNTPLRVVKTRQQPNTIKFESKM